MRRVLYILSSFILGLGILVNTGHTQTTPKSVSKTVRCPDDAPTTGWYRNYSYGFSITIPLGLKGYWNSVPCAKDKNDCVCMGDHGRQIPIRKGAYLEVVADHWIEETREESIGRVLEIGIETHKENGENAETLKRTAGWLNGFPASRLKLRYKDPKTGVRMIEEIIICAPTDREHSGEVYTIYLVTPESSYNKDIQLLGRVQRSWRFRKIP